MHPLKFNGNQSDFYTELKMRVNEYFSNKNKKQSGDSRLYTKAAILISGFLACYVVLVFFTPNLWISLALCMLMGVFCAGIGFNVMHDGGHGSFSEKKSFNRMAALTLNFLGCSSFFWNIKHNIVHHTYTNVDGHDDDIENGPLLRMASSQKRYVIHRYQQFYWLFVYGLIYIAWIFLLDFNKYFKRQVGIKKNIEIPVSTHIGFWLTKLIYIGLFIVIPVWQVGLWPFVAGYSLFMFTTGVIISVVFQLAHCIEEMQFPVADKIEKLETDWATHQMLTTSNFATRSKIVSFFTGGLNFQVEHHLFPKISHIHYPAVSKIVREVSGKHNVPYFEQPSVLSAVVSHVRFLRDLGRK